MTKLIHTHVKYGIPESTVGSPDLELLVEWEYTPAEAQTMTDPGCESESCLISIIVEDSSGYSHDITEILTASVQDDIFELAMAPE